MFSELFYSEKFQVPKRDSNPQRSDRLWDALTIELLGLRCPNSSMVRTSHRRSEDCGFESRLGTRRTLSYWIESCNIIVLLWWCSSSYLCSERFLSSQAGLKPTSFRSPVRRRQQCDCSQWFRFIQWCYRLKMHIFFYVFANTKTNIYVDDLAFFATGSGWV